MTAHLAADFQADQAFRAGTYALLAALLRAPPDDALFQRLLLIDTENTAVGSPAGDGDRSDDNTLPAAWTALRNAAATILEQYGQETVSAVNDEFHRLFIGIGRGELVPFGSWYLTGFLMEKPLSILRDDLAALGFERQQDVREPEDHIAALCEVMAMLIDDPDTPSGMQKKFYEDHVGVWAETFFRDLETARSAHFYRHVGRLGVAFAELEKRYMAMPV